MRRLSYANVADGQVHGRQEGDRGRLRHVREPNDQWIVQTMKSGSSDAYQMTAYAVCAFVSE